VEPHEEGEKEEDEELLQGVPLVYTSFPISFVCTLLPESTIVPQINCTMKLKMSSQTKYLPRLTALKPQTFLLRWYVYIRRPTAM
jgi:hypothetical protein